MIQIIGAEHTLEYHWKVYNYLLQQKASNLLWHLPTVAHLNPAYMMGLVSGRRDNPIIRAINKLRLELYCYEDLEAYNSFLQKDDLPRYLSEFVQEARTYPGFREFEKILNSLPPTNRFFELTRIPINLSRDIRSARNINAYTDSSLGMKYVYAGTAHIALKTELDKVHSPVNFVFLDSNIPAYTDDEFMYRIVANKLDNKSVSEIIEQTIKNGLEWSRMSIKELTEELFPEWVKRGNIQFLNV